MGAGGASFSSVQTGQRISVNTLLSPGWDVTIRYGKPGGGRLAWSALRIRTAAGAVGAWLERWLIGVGNGGDECNTKSISLGVGRCVGASDGRGRVCEGRLNGGGGSCDECVLNQSLSDVGSRMNCDFVDPWRSRERDFSYMRHE